MQIKSILFFIFPLIMTGCFNSQENLKLISQTEKGIAAAIENSKAVNKEIMTLYSNRFSQLDNAFDNDIKLKLTGKNPVDSNWIISARKGYSAGYKMIMGNIHNQISFHNKSLSNLSAIFENLKLLKSHFMKNNQIQTEIKNNLKKYLFNEVSNEQSENSKAN